MAHFTSTTWKVQYTDTHGVETKFRSSYYKKKYIWIKSEQSEEDMKVNDWKIVTMQPKLGFYRAKSFNNWAMHTGCKKLRNKQFDHQKEIVDRDSAK